jgi:ketosteroid isomerase-like protein
MDYHVALQGRRPRSRACRSGRAEAVAEWIGGSLVPTEFIAEGEAVVSLGDFTGTHGETGKKVACRYAHVWTVKGGKITRFRRCAILRKPKITDCLIKADRAQYDRQNSHERPT